MRSLRPFLARPSSGRSWRAGLSAGLEVAGALALLVALERVGRATPASDVVDLGVVVGGLLPVAALVALGVRRGRLPLTRAALSRVGRALRRRARALSPRYHVALRLPAGEPLHPERALVLPLLLAALGAGAALLLGPRLPGALTSLRGVAYTPYLLALLTLWTLALLVTAVALVLEAQGSRARRVALVWAAGLALGSLLPAAALLGALLLLGGAQVARMARRRLAPYAFCRRDARGRLLGLEAQTWLRRLHALLVLLTALVVSSTNAGRMFDTGLSHGPYGFTGGLGLIAAVAGLLLVAQVDLHFGRLLCVRTTPPETALVPTLAWLGPGPVPPDVAEAAAQGWRVTIGRPFDAEAVDLVTGPWAAGPTRLARAPELPPSERAFRRERRLHVVHRRDFLRRFRRLFKEARARRGAGGSGFLFCPHLWLVPTLLRDGRDGASPVGPTFGLLFGERLRRYLGMFLRDAGVDVVYWEDAVRWPDLRRVLGVAFECWDQRRLPLLERHFVGLPHVRVTLHEEGPEPGGPSPGSPTPGSRPFRTPVATGARILVVLRDRGGEGVRPERGAPADQRPAPIAR